MFGRLHLVESGSIEPEDGASNDQSLRGEFNHPNKGYPNRQKDHEGCGMG
jgi:hypothetical protein